MTYWELEKSAKDFYPVVALDAVITRRVRSISLSVFGVALAVLFMAAIPALFSAVGNVIVGTVLEPLMRFAHIAEGLFFVLFPFVAVLFSIHAFSNSYYFSGFDTLFAERLSKDQIRISYEVAAFFYGASGVDLTESFTRFSYGRLILLRAGVDEAELTRFLSKRTTQLLAEKLSVTPSSSDGKVRIFDVAIAIFAQDKEFFQFLFSQGIQEKNFSDASHWVSRDITSYKKRTRWWSRDVLGRIEGIGKDWSYGTAFRLRHYATDLTAAVLPAFSSMPRIIQAEVERLESALSKARGANALLVGEDGGGKAEVLRGFASKVAEGIVFPPLAHKRVYIFDTNRLVSSAGDKTKFEFECIKLLDEAVSSGNVIIVIEDFPAFIQSAASIGSGAANLLSKYLESSAVQFICLSSPTPFHQVIEPDATLLENFDVLILTEGESDDLMRELEDDASAVEAKQGILIPQPTLALIAESADRYITEGVMPDKAIDLLYEIAAKSAQEKKRRIGRGEVLEFVKAKTGIPTGQVTQVEKEKLINLEHILHERVVGQDEAVNAIASAMRRARSGVENPNRPMGSFLFMGPTGVGKTETTKALAEVFFGDEKHILRLDMSEYNGTDALSKLIGSFTGNTPGVLTSMLRERPYGVLLLDEFEKSSTEVMNLFLQVIDEGIFSDMHGKKVNARNLIIIATSNAGSDLIWGYIKRGENVAEKKNEVIEAVVSQGIFKLELLNRFDGVVLFQPIDEARLRQIAALMLEKFRARIRTRGIDLLVTDDLVDYLMRFGNDPKFGARPMNRAIQDVVEQKIADKIIKGEIKPGEKLVLTKEDLG